MDVKTFGREGLGMHSMDVEGDAVLTCPSVLQNVVYFIEWHSAGYNVARAASLNPQSSPPQTLSTTAPSTTLSTTLSTTFTLIPLSA